MTVYSVTVLKASPEAGGEVLAQLNKNITLSCNINRKEQITWTKDQQVINRNKIEEQQDSTSRTSAVTIEGVSEADQGEYSCKSRGLSASFSLKTFGENIYQFVNLNESHFLFQFTN